MKMRSCIHSIVGILFCATLLVPAKADLNIPSEVKERSLTDMLGQLKDKGWSLEESGTHRDVVLQPKGTRTLKTVASNPKTAIRFTYQVVITDSSINVTTTAIRRVPVELEISAQKFRIAVDPEKSSESRTAIAKAADRLAIAAVNDSKKHGGIPCAPDIASVVATGIMTTLLALTLNQ